MTEQDTFQSILEQTVDWNLLRLQKQQLLEKIGGERNSLLWGLVHLLDALEGVAYAQGLADPDSPTLQQLEEVLTRKPTDAIDLLDIEALLITMKQGSSTHEYTLTLENARHAYQCYVDAQTESDVVPLATFIEPCSEPPEGKPHLLHSDVKNWEWGDQIDPEQEYKLSLAWKSSGYILKELHKQE